MSGKTLEETYREANKMLGVRDNHSRLPSSKIEQLREAAEQAKQHSLDPHKSAFLSRPNYSFFAQHNIARQ